MSMPRQQSPRGSDPASRGGNQTPERQGVGKIPFRRNWLWLGLILVINYFLVKALFSTSAPAVPYTLFKKEVQNGNVEAIYSHGETIMGRFVKAVTYPTKEEAEKKG